MLKAILLETIVPDKVHCFSNPKVLIHFLLLHINIYCGYSLEAPR